MTLGSLWILLRVLAVPTDIYITVAPENIWVAWALKALTGARVVHAVHEHFELDIPTRHYLPACLVKPVLRFYRLLKENVLPRLDGIIAATPLIAEECVALNANTVTINNYPPLMSEEPLPWNKRERSVCYVGNMFAARGIRELVQAMSHTDVTLHLVGRFDPPELRDKLAELPGWSNVKEWGFLPYETAMKIMAGCSAGMITLSSGRQHQSQLCQQNL